MTAIVKTQDLSPAARTALTNAAPREGAKVRTYSTQAREELEREGLISPTGHLTRAGWITRERIQTEDLEDLFG